MSSTGLMLEVIPGCFLCVAPPTPVVRWLPPAVAAGKVHLAFHLIVVELNRQRQRDEQAVGTLAFREESAG